MNSESTEEKLLNRFFTSFQRGDAKGMCSCYHEKATFTDPAFGQLNRKQVDGMWTMLLSRKESDISIEFFDIEANPESGEGRWIATYRYGQKKRRVKNKVHSKFEFQDGKISKQVDDFDLWIWSKQALGSMGSLLGWSSFLRNKIQTMARKKLDSFMSNQEK